MTIRGVLAIGLFGVSLAVMGQGTSNVETGMSFATCDAATQMQMALAWPYPVSDIGAARCLMQAGNGDGAMRLLRLAVAHPAFSDVRAIEDEPAFAGLHGDPGWTALMAEAQLKAHRPPAVGAGVDLQSKLRNPPHAVSKANGINLSGLVVLIVQVAPDDAVYRVDVETSSGHPELDAAAVDAVKAWKYHAGVAGAVHFGGAVRIPIQYGRPRRSGRL